MKPCFRLVNRLGSSCFSYTNSYYINHLQKIWIVGAHGRAPLWVGLIPPQSGWKPKEVALATSTALFKGNHEIALHFRQPLYGGLERRRPARLYAGQRVRVEKLDGRGEWLPLFFS
jgi:hypothetical protein